MKTKFILILLLSIVLFSCGDDGDATRHTLTVGSSLGSYTKPDNEVIQCLYVKFNDNQNWEAFPWLIEGFRYSLGYEYVIVVDQVKLENTQIGGPQYKWILKDEISKEKKSSGGLPAF